MVSPKRIVKQFAINEINELTELDKQAIKFSIPNLDQGYDYQNCFSSKYSTFDFCNQMVKDTFHLPNLINDNNFYIAGKKGFIYYNKEYAYVHPKMKQNVFENGNDQFGFPISISVSDDGSSRLTTYNKPRKDLDYVCYHEIFIEKQNKYEFKQDCDKVSKSIKFNLMKKVKLPKTIYIFLSEEDPTSSKSIIKQRLISVNFKYNFLIQLSSVTGQRIENPNILLYLLYPPAFIFDIITFPVQIFVVPFGKTALG
jgi:hypothetical protein